MPRAVRTLAEAGGSSEPQGTPTFIGAARRFAHAGEGGPAAYGEGVTRSVSATGTGLDSDGLVFLTGTGTYTWNLPTAAGKPGLTMRFVKTGASGVVTLDPAGAETINNAAT